MIKALAIAPINGQRVMKALNLIKTLANYGVAVTYHHQGSISTLKRVADFLGDADSTEPALIIYMGNGTRAGWQINETESVSYQELRQLLCRTAPKRRLCVLNDTPFGQMLIKELIGERDPLYTSCLTHSRFAESVNIGEITSLAIKTWNDGQRPEQRFAALAPGNLGAWHTVPIWQRWGEHFEKVFLNNKAVNAA